MARLKSFAVATASVLAGGLLIGLLYLEVMASLPCSYHYASEEAQVLAVANSIVSFQKQFHRLPNLDSADDKTNLLFQPHSLYSLTEQHEGTFLLVAAFGFDGPVFTYSSASESIECSL